MTLKGETVLDNTPINIEQYEAILNYFSSKKSSTTTMCLNQQQAELLLNKLFENTRSIVKIIVGTFPPKLTEHLYQEKLLKKCIDNSIKIQALIAEENVAVSHFFESVFNNNEKLCKVGKINPEAAELLKSPMTYKNGHFMTCFLFDENKYTLQLKENSFESSASFNSKDTAKELNKIFDRAFLKSDLS